MISCNSSSKTQTEFMKNKEWNDSFIQYYLSERKFDWKDVELAISTLTNDISLRTKLEEIAKKQLEGDRGSIGTLGEAHLSYMLEKKRNIILTKAGWKDSPFDVVKGTDLVGVCLQDLLIVLVQVKTRPKDSARPFTIRDLKNDISLKKLEPSFLKRFGSSSYATVVSTFERLNRLHRSPPSNGVSKIRDDVYMRLGVILTGNAEFWGNIDDADPGDSSSTRPCQLILYVIEDLSSKLGQITAFEIRINDLVAEKRIV